MSEIASAKINSFAPIAEQTDFPVSPSEEAVFILNSGQLSALITQAVQKALQPLQDRVSTLEDKTVSLEEENAVLRLKLTTLETQQEEDITRLCVDICQDRRRLATLEQRPSTTLAPSAPPRGEKTIARIAKIDEVLKARGPTTLKEMERILKISPKEMNRLLAKLDMRRYELHVRPGDAREKVLRLKVQIR